MDDARKSIFERLLLKFSFFRSLQEQVNYATNETVAIKTRLAEAEDCNRNIQERQTGIEGRQDRAEEHFRSFIGYHPSPEIINMPYPQLRQHAIKILSLLQPKDVVGKHLIRRGRDFDGGYVMLNHASEDVVVYSLGISDDVSWDLAMADMGCQIFQYDHTISRIPIPHPKFRWFKIGIDDGSGG